MKKYSLLALLLFAGTAYLVGAKFLKSHDVDVNGSVEIAAGINWQDIDDLESINKKKQKTGIHRCVHGLV